MGDFPMSCEFSEGLYQGISHCAVYFVSVQRAWFVSRPWVELPKGEMICVTWAQTNTGGCCWNRCRFQPDIVGV